MIGRVEVSVCRLELTMYPRLVLNLNSSCLSIPTTKIAGLNNNAKQDLFSLLIDFIVRPKTKENYHRNDVSQIQYLGPMFGPGGYFVL